MAESNAADAALASLETARSDVEGIESGYAPVYAAMVEQISTFVTADRDGELEQYERMLTQLKSAWEAEKAGETA